MRTALAVALMISVAGCSSQSDQAAKRLTLLEQNSGTPRERCAAARDLAAASVKEGDAAKYRDAQFTVLAECSAVDAFPAYADIPAGMPKATDAEIANGLASLDAMENGSGAK